MRPQWPKIRQLIEANNIFFRFRRAHRHNVINVPFTHIAPCHARGKLAFEVFPERVLGESEHIKDVTVLTPTNALQGLAQTSSKQHMHANHRIGIAISHPAPDLRALSIQSFIR